MVEPDLTATCYIEDASMRRLGERCRERSATTHQTGDRREGLGADRAAGHRKDPCQLSGLGPEPVPAREQRITKSVGHGRGYLCSIRTDLSKQQLAQVRVPVRSAAHRVDQPHRRPFPEEKRRLLLGLLTVQSADRSAVQDPSL